MANSTVGVIDSQVGGAAVGERCESGGSGSPESGGSAQGRGNLGDLRRLS